MIPRLLLALLLLLTLGGCAVLPRFVPQCEGEPSQMPCIGACRVRLAAPVPIERTMPEALVIRDHTGQVRCQEVS